MVRFKEQRGLTILGSTGSIGRQALEVVGRFPDRLRVETLVAARSWRLLAEQARRYRASQVILAFSEGYRELVQALADLEVRVEVGKAAVREAVRAAAVDWVLAAQAGLAGLEPVLWALEAGKTVALANKEPLVAGGRLVMQLGRLGENILPVDSEHSAIFQAIDRRTADVSRLILTASGGAFRDLPVERLAEVTPAAALQNPNWAMGPKITVDSATLMNKGLEILEAHHLFGIPLERIEAIGHPESIVHSLVELRDGSTLAQLGWPDMRGPIQYALSYPERWPEAVAPLDLLKIGTLRFQALREGDFPCLRLAVQAGKMGRTLPAVLSAANEVAVGAFIEGRLGFMGIPAIIEGVLGRHRPMTDPDLGQLLTADGWAREEAARLIGEGS